MITCSICHTSNHHLAIVCSSCGGFVQNRIDNLDLFALIWKIIESPSKAFRTIAIAKHKNYSILLPGVAGIAFAFFVFWLFKFGDHAESLVNILGGGFAVGPFLGILTVLIFSLILILTTKLNGLDVKFRNTYATVAYVCVPVVLSFIFIFPVEIMTFGIFLFTKNPSPYSLKPMSYILLMILDGTFTAWSFVLLFVGIKALLDVPWLKVCRIVLLSLFLFGGLAVGIQYLIDLKW